MAWRIGDSIVRGEIDNRIPGIIKGVLYLNGLKTPVELELEGDCEPDLAGRQLIFRNLLPAEPGQLEGFLDRQCGETGTMTAARMVRIPSVPDSEVARCLKEHRAIPTRWSESLYLEWFSDNGRVVIEGPSFACELSPRKWEQSDEQHRWTVHIRDLAAARGLPFHDGSDDDMESADADSGADGSDEDEDANLGAAGLGERDDARAYPGGSAPGSRVPGGPWLVRPTDGRLERPHPLAEQTARLMMRAVCESKHRRHFSPESLENQPIEDMLESLVQATVRMAHGTTHGADLWSLLDPGERRQQLRRARHALLEAAQHADLARHWRSADGSWLKGIRGELADLRRRTHRFLLELESSAGSGRSRPDQGPRDRPSAGEAPQDTVPTPVATEPDASAARFGPGPSPGPGLGANGTWENDRRGMDPGAGAQPRAGSEQAASATTAAGTDTATVTSPPPSAA